MQATPTYRWEIGFIAMRWRHVFWLLPLAGLLTALGLQFRMLYGPAAIGAIHVSPLPIPLRQARLADVINVLQSDETLSKTVESLNLSTRWKNDPVTCMTKLRESIHGEAILHKSQVELHVSSSSRSESIEIWKMLFRNAKGHFADIETAAEEASLTSSDAMIEALQLDYDTKQRKLSEDPMVENHTRPQEIEQKRDELEAARKSLEKAKTESPRMRIACSDAYLHIQKEPAFPPPSLTRWETLRPLLLGTGIGFSIGMILTAPVAYLLELLLPRRRLELEN